MSINKTRSPNTFWVIVILLVPLVVIAGLMVGAGSGQVAKAPLEAKSQNVDVVSVVLQDQYQQLQITYGRIEASNQSTVSFELAGQVTQVLVDEGDSIMPGDTLAILDTSRLDAQMKELDASLARAQADLQLARLSLDRVTDLVQRKLESSQRLDEATQQATAAAALVKEIQARQDTLSVEQEKSILVADFSATVLERPVDPGTVVAAGQAVLQVQAQHQFEARIALPSERAFNLKIGQTVPLLVAGKDLNGKVKSIASQRKLDTRTVDVIFSLDISDDSHFLPGDLVGYSDYLTIRESGLWVPRQALSSGIRGLWTLFVVPDLGQQEVVSKSVEVLYADGDSLFVRGTISEQDWVIVSGAQKLVPGQRVQVAKLVTSNPTTTQYSNSVGG